MKTIPIFCAFLCSIGLKNSVVSVTWIDSLTRYVVEDPRIRQVTFLTTTLSSERSSSRKIEELCAKMMEKLPIVRLNLAEDSYYAKIKTPYNFTEDFVKMDTTTNLLVIVHESHENLPILPSRALIDVASWVSEFHYRPRYFLLFVNRRPTDSLREILSYAWSQNIIDLTIFELSEPEVPKSLRPSDLDPQTIVHQLNVFKNEYKKIPWDPTLDWFPNKVKNMMGHPLRVAAVDSPPFSYAQFNHFREPVSIGGATIRLIRAIAGRLNASLKYLPIRSKYYRDSKAPRILHTRIRSKKIDLQSYISPHYTASIRDRTLRTTMIIFDKWCPVVPILPISRITLSINVLENYLLTFGIVGIFGISRLVFRFSRSSRWQPFYLLRVLFAIPVNCKPEKNAERIIFGCLLVISTIYSNNMYSSITDMSLQTNGVREFESFEDLDRSNLVPIITALALNKTFNILDPVLQSLRNKSIRAPYKMWICPKLAAKYKNITCFMSKREATIATMKIKSRYGREEIKIAEPCFWSDSRGILVGAGSPFLYHFDFIILRMHSAGLIEKMYEYRNDNSSELNDNDLLKIIPSRKKNMAVLRGKLVAVIIIGYVVSVIVLLAEFAFHWTVKNFKLKSPNFWKKISTFTKNSIVKKIFGD